MFTREPFVKSRPFERKADIEFIGELLAETTHGASNGT
jgi:hypothetical protein